MKEAITSDFTEARYRTLLEHARNRFRFCKFNDELTSNGIALWRHDIDFSPQRALALARIESQLGVTATYFVMLGSPFYNVFERTIQSALREIVDLGHDVGLHYDATAADGNTSIHVERIGFEAATLERQLNIEIRSFSLHNPSVAPDTKLDQIRYGKLVNASAPSLRTQFTYVSDSNGLWRYTSLHDILLQPVTQLYALTHAEWWTPGPMAPRARVQRCVEGRAEQCLRDYDALLESQGRPNVRK